MILDARLVLLAQLRFEAGGILADRIENAALAFHPAFVTGSENTVEQFMRDHLRRQGAIAAGPAQIALNALAERLLAHADLQRAEARFAADLRGDRLIDGAPAGAAAGEGSTRYQRAHRPVMIVARPGHTRRRIIEACDDMDIVAKRRQR